MAKVVTGLESLALDPRPLKGLRIGLLCHQASIDSRLRQAKNILFELFGKDLKCLFSPQHGLYADKQDNMVESEDMIDEDLGIPVFSLYGKRRKPSTDSLSNIDCLIIDLQDVGTRVYTYIWTMCLCMKEAAKAGIKVVVLDRPNPLGGERVEGNLLSPDFFSFVGMAQIPMRHGMTIGEIALYLRREFGLDLDLKVIKMAGWNRRMYFDETGLPWVWPSPNMPTLDTALVYPGQVLLEGTNLSEGRGTTRPFEVFGAPYLDIKVISREMEGSDLKGFYLRPQYFEPTFHKWHGETCKGVQIHVIDRYKFEPYLFTLTLLSVVMRHFKDDFSYKLPPYEYEFERLPMDLLIGKQEIRMLVEDGMDSTGLREVLRRDQEAFCEMRQAYLLY
ncbi:exo-beta-N-acetylmuramidase NamZ family protein [Dissulfuribacter thermophilus]|nr:DUF1343 domain-containing protein [Dissulfuribacter thermophilus]